MYTTFGLAVSNSKLLAAVRSSTMGLIMKGWRLNELWEGLYNVQMCVFLLLMHMPVQAPG